MNWNGFRFTRYRRKYAANSANTSPGSGSNIRVHVVDAGVVLTLEDQVQLADGMEISLTDHEIRMVLARLEDIPEDQRIESGISSGAAIRPSGAVSRTVDAMVLLMLASLQVQIRWKMLPVVNGMPGCITGCQTVVMIQACALRKRRRRRHQDHRCGGWRSSRIRELNADGDRSVADAWSLLVR
ncbi:DUF1380 family protein [Escherichia coli]